MAGEHAPPRHRRFAAGPAAAALGAALCLGSSAVRSSLIADAPLHHGRGGDHRRVRSSCRAWPQSHQTTPEHGRKVQARRSSKLNLEEAGKKPGSVNLEEALCYVNCAGASNLGKLWLYRNEKNSAKCMAWKLSLECAYVIANCIHCNLSLESTECCIALQQSVSVNCQVHMAY